MGFQTEISILNDNLHVIDNDLRKWWDSVKRALNASPGEHTYVLGQTTVHPSHHTDEPRIYISERNGFYDLGEYGIERSLRKSLADDFHLDFYEDEIDRTIKMLKDSKKYVQYLRDEVGFDERPGGKDYYPGNDHHIKSWRWKKAAK